MKGLKIAQRTFSIIFRIVLFVGAVALILYLFPVQGKFKYEYEKGKPWRHTQLLAPFDFPVLKTDRELKKERDSLLQTHKPYYIIDTSAVTGVLSEVEKRFVVKWESISGRILRNDTLRKENFWKDFSAIVSGVYSEGIISNSELSRLNLSGVQQITIQDVSFARNKMLGDVQTTLSAYQHIIKILEQRDTNSELLKLVKELELNNFLRDNLKPDKFITEKMKTELLQNVSVNSGMILQGQKIIGSGEIVGNQEFKVLESLKKEYEARLGASSKRYLVLGGQGLLIVAILISLFIFLYFYRIDIFNNNKDFFFILVNIVLFIVASAAVVRLTGLRLYFLPFAILPIILRTFFDSRIAIFANTITILMISFLAVNSYEFVLLELMAGLAATFSLKDLENRNQLVRSSLIVFLTLCLIYFGMSLMQEGDITKVDYYYFAYFGVNGLLVLFAYPLVYIYEKLFGYVSNVTLMELSNTNNELLRKLSENAPGTFQHSMQVANLAEAAVQKIGGNPLLARTGAYYHDIGKAVKPVFFTENQSAGINPHEGLNEKESAKVIINHVIEGARMAQKAGLPKSLVDFILTHHGTGKTKFFYINYKNNHPDSEINPNDFSYPGPIPFSKELAVVMMADAIEATSRSLKEYTDEAISETVDRIIDIQISEGQFRDAPITFRDIEVIRETFKEKLRNMYHTRISYPKEKK